MGPFGPPAPLLGTQGGRGCSTSLGPGASGPPGDDRYEQFNSSFLYQQARRDSVPRLVTSGSEAFYVVTSSEYSCPSKTHPRLSKRDSRPPMSGSEAFYVVTSSEYSCPSKTHPRLSERDSRPPISSQPADIDRVEPPSRNLNRIFGVRGPQ